MASHLSVRQEDNKEILFFQDKPIITIIKNEVPEVVYHGNVSFTIEGDLLFSVNGETNLVSRGFNLDTLYDYFKTSINLNSRLSKQIINTDESKKYRNLVNKKLDLVNTLHEIQDEIKDRRVKILNELKLNRLSLEEKIDLLIKLNVIDDDLRDEEEEVIKQIKSIEEELA